MSLEIVTKEDLEMFRIQLLDDLKRIFPQTAVSDYKNDWIKSAEARKLLNASPGTLQNLRNSGKLHPVKIAGSWYYSRSEIAGLFNKCK